MSNLGDYQILTTLAKKVGGPKRLIALIAGGGAVVGGIAVKGGKFAFEKCKKAIAKRRDKSKKLNESTQIRIMEKSDYVCLDELLYQAIYIPKGESLPSRSIINNPDIFIYINDFGDKLGDLGVVSEVDGQVVGGAWTRIIPAYGHIDENTPELAISILPEFRGYGIGTKLMKKLFKLLKESGYKQTSLSVQKNNPAVSFYKRLGYEIVDEKYDHVGHEDYLMIKYL